MMNLDTIKIKGLEIPIRLNSSRNVKNFKIGFNVNKGYMNISKPTFMKLNEVKKCIEKNEELIYTKYLKMLEYKKEIDIQKDENKRKWITGEKLLFLGKEYEIEIKEVKENITKLSFIENDKIVIFIKTGLDIHTRNANILKIIKNMLKLKTEEVVEKRLDYWTKITGIDYNVFKVKYVKTRWGSCVKNRKSLNFSSRLAMFPLRVIDAVVVHELCHIIYPNHSNKYWELVYKFIPKYKECNDWIKQNMNKFELE